MSQVSQQDAKAVLLADLKARIAKPSNGFDVAAGVGRVVPLGVDAIDAALPGRGLKAGALHEVTADDYRDMGAATGFLAALAVRLAEGGFSPVLWCGVAQPPFDIGALYGPGLASFGLDPARLVLVHPASATDCLWAMEETLRSGAFAVVVGEIDGRVSALDLTATRRLQLAAEEKGVPALLFTGHEGGAASAAATRWRVSALPSSLIPDTDKFGGLIEAPGWRMALTRSRGGVPGAWNVTWHARDRRFMLADNKMLSSAGEKPYIPAGKRAVPLRQSA